MASKPLTDAQLRNAKPSDKQQKLFDGHGLFLLVTPAGGKLWRFKYRIHGKERLLSIGAYPAISLSDARRRRDEARTALAQGQDPSQLKAERARAATPYTFNEAADEYLAHLERQGRAPATLTKARWLLEEPRRILGKRVFAGIEVSDIAGVLTAIAGRGVLETALRTRQIIGAVFRRSVTLGKIKYDPTPSLKGVTASPSVHHRATIVEREKLGGLLRALWDYDGHAVVRIALQLLPYLFVRPGELRSARWQDFDFDKNEWTIPAALMKMRRPHRVPLAPQVIHLLNELHTLTGRGELLFPSVRSSQRPISENTLNAAYRRLGYDKTEITAHGFRATASVFLNESGKWNADAIERQLAHEEQNAIRAAYVKKAEFWEERVQMMRFYADFLDAVRER
jgi:integrase